MGKQVSGKKLKSAIGIADRVLLIVLCVAIVLVETMYLRVSYMAKSDSIASETKQYGESIAVAIEVSLEKNTNVAKALGDLYIEYPDTIADNFQSICSNFCRDYKAVRSMYIAPKGVLTYAYPEDVNTPDVIGFNILEDPDQAAMAQLAIDTNKATVAGPHDLVEGGTGIVIREPLYQDGEFDAFSIVVLDWNAFISETLSKVSASSDKYDFAIWKDDSSAVADEFGFIYNSCGTNIDKSNSIVVEVPNDTWYIAVVPKGGINMLKELLPNIVGSLLICILVIVVVAMRVLRASQQLNGVEYDELTGLYTKQAFYHYVRQLIDKNPNTQYDLVEMDVENFKMINSTYGEIRGDELLVYIADFMMENNDFGGIIARLGGDQFVMLIENKGDRDITWLVDFDQKLLSNAPIANLVLKYGVYENVDHDLSVSVMTDRAILATNSIKRNYEVNIASFNGEISRKHLKSKTFENEFEEALANGEFDVWFQPKFDAKTEKIVSAEALVRWKKSDGTIISPGEFIPVFENDGLIAQLDEFVFKDVCKKIKFWLDKDAPMIPISINLSRASLYHEATVKKYKDFSNQLGIPTEFVPIELTESADLQTNQISDLVKEIKDAGFHLYMDDFGAGVSSLASFNNLPFDVLKLDKSLIDCIGDPGGEELLKHIIPLAHFKGMTVVAEGVENKEQLEFLKSLDCDTIQGFYFSAPKPYDEFIKFLIELNQNEKGKE